MCIFQVFPVGRGRNADIAAEDAGKVGLVIETHCVTDIRDTGTRVLQQPDGLPHTAPQHIFLKGYPVALFKDATELAAGYATALGNFSLRDLAVQVFFNVDKRGFYDPGVPGTE